MENNENDMDVDTSNLHCLGEAMGSAQDWLSATASDDISTVHDWTAAGLFGSLGCSYDFPVML